MRWQRINRLIIQTCNVEHRVNAGHWLIIHLASGKIMQAGYLLVRKSDMQVET